MSRWCLAIPVPLRWQILRQHRGPVGVVAPATPLSAPMLPRRPATYNPFTNSTQWRRLAPAGTDGRSLTAPLQPLGGQVDLEHAESRPLLHSPEYTRGMAMQIEVERLEIEDVVLIDLPELGGEVEAKVVRPIDRTETTVRVSLEVEGLRTSSRSGLRAR